MRYERIVRYESHGFHKRLRDEDAVEWVVMMGRKVLNSGCMFRLDR